MAKAQRTEIFDVGIEKIYSVLSDFESYPDFMDGVSKVEIIETKNDNKIIGEYSINIIKKFRYTMEHELIEPTRISWSFVEGDLFKESTGEWVLKSLEDDKTEVTYSIDVDFKMMVPKMISSKLVSSNLPSMFKAVQKKAKEQ